MRAVVCHELVAIVGVVVSIEGARPLLEPEEPEDPRDGLCTPGLYVLIDKRATHSWVQCARTGVARRKQGSRNMLMESTVRELREMLGHDVLDVAGQNLLHGVEEVLRRDVPCRRNSRDVFLDHDKRIVVGELARRGPAGR